MSGGSYEYVFGRIEGAAHELRDRHDEPHILALAEHLDRIAGVMRAIEWADSGDTLWTEELHDQIRALLGPGADLSTLIAQAGELYLRIGTALEHQAVKP